MLKFVVLLALLLGPPREPRVGLVVSPHFVSSRPAVVKASITIDSDDRNRGACLVWQSENEEGSHCWEHLDEKDFPPRIEYKVILHYEGIYEFQLSVVRTDSIVRTPVQEVEVH